MFLPDAYAMVPRDNHYEDSFLEGSRELITGMDKINLGPFKEKERWTHTVLEVTSSI
jgi:hypothetical protein